MRKQVLLTTTLTVAWILSTCSVIAADTTPLNDTGIDWCINHDQLKLDCPQPTHPNQDAQSGRDLLAKQGKLKKVGAGHAGFDFTKLDAEGNPLPPEAEQWACVRDNHTGLDWEVKSSNGGLQDKNHTYSWYNPDPSRNGGNAGTRNSGICKGSDCDTQAYIEAINARGLCGHKDWRLPTMTELRSIVNYSRIDPAIDIQFFPDVPKPRPGATLTDVEFWSVNTHVGNNESGWSIDFHGGLGYSTSKQHDFIHVRLVRTAN